MKKKIYIFMVTVCLIACYTISAIAASISLGNTTMLDNINQKPENIDISVDICYNNKHHEKIILENTDMLLTLAVKNNDNKDKNLQFVVTLLDDEANLIDIAKNDIIVPVNETVHVSQDYFITPNMGVNEIIIYVWDDDNDKPYVPLVLTKNMVDYYGNNINEATFLEDFTKNIVGEITGGLDEDYFTFIASESRKYIFSCHTINNSNITGNIYNQNNELICSNSGNSQFLCCVDLIEGTRYFLQIVGERNTKYETTIFPMIADSTYGLENFDTEISSYKNQILSLAEQAYVNNDFTLSEEIYREYKKLYDIDYKLHDFSISLKDSSNIESLLNSYYEANIDAFDNLKKSYLIALNKYSTMLNTSESGTLMEETYEVLKKSDFNVSSLFGDDILTSDDTVHLLSDSGSPCITVTQCSPTSIKYIITSDKQRDSFGLVDLNRQTVVMTNQITDYIPNIEYTIDNLMEGGLYYLAYRWHENDTEHIITYRVMLPYAANNIESNYTLSGKHILLTLESNDLTSFSSKEYCNEWLKRMDIMYEKMLELTNYTPYVGEKLEIKSTRIDVNHSLSSDSNSIVSIIPAYSGNPALISRPLFVGMLQRIPTGDWEHYSALEIADSFNMSNWCFDTWALNEFIVCYILDNCNGSKMHFIDAQKDYTKNNIFNYYKSDCVSNYDNMVKSKEYSSYGMTAILIKLKDIIGWPAFKSTFAYMNNLSNDEQNYIYALERNEAIGKFNIFITRLRDFSGVDVLSKLNETEKNIIGQEFGGDVEYYNETITITGGNGGQANINLPAGNVAIRKFIAPESGEYEIYTSRYSGVGKMNDTFLQVYSNEYFNDEDMIAYNDNISETITFSKVSITLNKNQSCYIKISNNQGDKVFADLQIVKKAVNVTAGKTVAVETSGMESAVVKFSPNVSGNYIIKTTEVTKNQTTEIDSILRVYKEQNGVYSLISKSHYKHDNFPQILSRLEQGCTYYIVYSGYLTAPAKANLQLILNTNNPEIKDAVYNQTAGPIIAENNTLTFSINLNGIESNGLRFVPCLSWDNVNFYDKEDCVNYTTFTNGRADVTITNVRLYGEKAQETLYTKIKIYDSSDNLLWYGPNDSFANRAGKLLTVELDDNYRWYDKIQIDNHNLFLKLNKEIPANKVVVVSYFTHNVKEIPDDKYENYKFEAGEYIGQEKITYFQLYDKDYSQYRPYPYGGWNDANKMGYFKIEKSGEYIIRIPIKPSVSLEKSAYISIYTVDYVYDSKKFKKMDALENISAKKDKNYLIFNSPEHLMPVDGATQLADEYNCYLAYSDINGNANIYWEHVNEYGQDLMYGILLHNPSSESVEFCINKVSARHQANSALYGAFIEIWDNYFNDNSDENNITNTNTTFRLAGNESKWIYLDSIPGNFYNSTNTFNGIINLSIYNDKSIDCYAFLMNMETDSIVKERFDKCKRLFKAAPKSDSEKIHYLSGAGNGAMLYSNIDEDDFSNSEYTLVLTGEDMPYINAGEQVMIYNYPSKKLMENSYNYSVIYKFDVELEAPKTITFSYNPYTNPAFTSEPDSGLYVAYAIKDYDKNEYIEVNSDTLLTPKYTNKNQEVSTTLPTGHSILYVVVSGMSSMPLTMTLCEE